MDYVLYDMSYANTVMYGAVLPSYKHGRKKGGGKGEPVRADDPKNRDKVKQLLDTFR